jgi:hypothetical protein
MLCGYSWRVNLYEGWGMRSSAVYPSAKEARGVMAARSNMDTMDDLRFDRHFRTPSSEGYYLVRGQTRIGMVDLHFTSTTVHGTLIIEQEMERDALAQLIERIDEDLVLSADTPRDDFLVSVYSGKEVGFFNDTFRADQEDLVADLDEDEDDEDDEFDDSDDLEE